MVNNLRRLSVIFVSVFLLVSCGNGSGERTDDNTLLENTDAAETGTSTETSTETGIDNHSSGVANSIRLGLHLGFTGAVETLVEAMALGAEVAMTEASNSGMFLNGTTVTSVRADSTCVSADVALNAFEELLAADVSGVVGSVCSGVTTAVLTDLAVPAGMVMISPASTSPSLTTVEDNGLFFRTVPSDARQGALISQTILDRGFQTAAITFTNDTYGKLLAGEIQRVFETNGGAVTISGAHENGAADYSDLINALAAAGGDVLVVVGYFDQGGGAILRDALNSGAFTTAVLSDGMVDESLPNEIGFVLNGSFGFIPESEGEGANRFADIAMDFEATSPFAAESYDAAALILLAMQAANSSDPNTYKSKIFDVANAPGEIIYPGEISKALELLADGRQIDYVGAANIELIEPGDNAGRFREIGIQNGTLVTVGFH